MKKISNKTRTFRNKQNNANHAKKAARKKIAKQRVAALKTIQRRIWG